MTSLERKLRRQLRELGYYLKVSPAQKVGTPIDFGSDYGLYQISDGNNIVAGWRYDLTLEDVAEWISEQERTNEWMYAGGDCE